MRKNGKDSGRRRRRPPIRLATRWLDVPTAPDLQTLYSWWSACKGGESLGITPEFVIQAIKPFQSQVIVTDVIGDRQDYFSRTAGSLWTQMLGRNVTNGFLSQYVDMEVQQKCRGLFHRVIETRAPLVIDTPPPARQRTAKRSTQMIFLPLTAPSGEITHFITALPRQRS